MYAASAHVHLQCSVTFAYDWTGCAPCCSSPARCCQTWLGITIVEEAKKSRRMGMVGACQISAAEHVGFGLEGSSPSARDLTWILPGAWRSQALRHESQRLGLTFLIHSWANGLYWGCLGAHSASCRATHDVQDVIECALLQMRFPGRMCCALKSVLLQQDNQCDLASWWREWDTAPQWLFRVAEHEITPLWDQHTRVNCM